MKRFANNERIWNAHTVEKNNRKLTFQKDKAVSLHERDLSTHVYLYLTI